MATIRINKESVESMKNCKDVFEFLGNYLRTHVNGIPNEIMLSNSLDGNTYAPSPKKNYYKTTNFVFSPDSFKDLDEMMNATQICIIFKK